jgi:hypothetical protein
MAKDGELAFVVGDIEKTEHFSLAFQALPWLETSFRYSHYAPGSQNYDRSFGLKARLFTEEKGFADVSVGIRDLLGTGIYSSEYLVASKHVGPLDFTAGLGWGRLADTRALPNPFAQIFPSFKTRNGPSTITGGVVDFGQFFHGPKIGMFGGAVWNTPIDGLSLIAEYSSDKYARERGEFSNTFPVRSPVNLGLSYKIADSLSVGAGWYYGSSYGFTLALSTDPTQSHYPARVGPAVPPVSIRTDIEQQQAVSLLVARHTQDVYTWPSPTQAELTRINLRQILQSESSGVRYISMQGTTLIIDAHADGAPRAQCDGYARIVAASRIKANTIALGDMQDGDGNVTFCSIPHVTIDENQWASQLKSALDKQHLSLAAVSVGESELWLYYGNSHYNHESEALGRVIRILMQDAPSSVELFHIFPVLNGMPTQEVTVARSSLERVNQTPGAVAQMNEAVLVNSAPLYNPVLDSMQSHTYPRFSWGIAPGLTEQLFDPNKPIQFRLYAGAGASATLAPGLSIGTTLTATLWDDYNFSRPADSVLPHVRTDLLKYLKYGANGISYLGIDYQTRLAPDVFAEAKAGYLEDMFMGVGGQILWRPEGSRFAFGVDGYQVWKRDFDRLFGIQKYNVATGHVAVYYESPWYGLDFSVHAGRYLAGDYGATFQVSRRFLNGIEVGAFATFTNVPFKKFGEGSFDKGIFVNIPLEAALPIYTQANYGVTLHSLTRDGGQRLDGDDALYGETRRTSYGEIASRFDELTQP